MADKVSVVCDPLVISTLRCLEDLAELCRADPHKHDDLAANVDRLLARVLTFSIADVERMKPHLRSLAEKLKSSSR
jgi:hypothetical protein